MKYLSVLLFALAFSWTWSAITSIPPVGIQTHSGIQASMAEMIEQTLKTKKPTAKDLVIQRMKTQEGEEGEVLVYFQYKFSEYDAENNPVTSQIAGVAQLTRSEKKSEDGKDHWVLKKVTTTNDVMTFEEGFRITAGPSNPEISESPENAEPNSSAAAPAAAPGMTPEATSSPSPTPIHE